MGAKIKDFKLELFKRRTINQSSGCWEWIKSVGSNGYPEVQWRTKHDMPHKHMTRRLEKAFRDGARFGIKIERERTIALLRSDLADLGPGTFMRGKGWADWIEENSK